MENSIRLRQSGSRVIFTETTNALDSSMFPLVMLRYIENIDISFRYRYIESYRIGRLNIGFLNI